jgi:hypothetical protein
MTETCPSWRDHEIESTDMDMVRCSKCGAGMSMQAIRRAIRKASDEFERAKGEEVPK